MDELLGEKAQQVATKCRELLLEAEVEAHTTIHSPGEGNCGGFFRSHLTVKDDLLTATAVQILLFSEYLAPHRESVRYGARCSYDITEKGIAYLNKAVPERKVEGKWYGPPL